MQVYERENIRPTQPPSYPLFYFYQKPFSQVQAIIPGFHLSRLLACAVSNLGLVSLYKRHRKHDHILHSKPAGRAIAQMCILNPSHLGVETTGDSNLWLNRHNMNHHNIQEYTSMPYIFLISN